ncbi:MAG: glycosyltransferase family 2 protein [Erysipelotrichaceae bacterium]
MISIIVPVYNVESYLARCIESLINQSYQDLQIILVNDGSTDGSLALCDQYEKKDHRIQVVSKENGGLSSARNHGMKYAKGEYIFFVDSDDFIKLDAMKLMYDKAISEKADLVVCDMEYLYDNQHIEFASGGQFSAGDYQSQPDLLFINNSACNKLIHKGLLDNFEFPTGLWYEDLGSIPLLIVKAKHIVKVDKALYVYYQREGSIAHSANQKIFDIYKAIKLIEQGVDKNIKSLYIVHGLDLTTLRIKDFDDKAIRKSYLIENMKCLNNYYPMWHNDDLLKSFDLKKRIIFKLLQFNLFGLVLKIYDRSM